MMRSSNLPSEHRIPTKLRKSRAREKGRPSLNHTTFSSNDKPCTLDPSDISQSYVILPRPDSIATPKDQTSSNFRRPLKWISKHVGRPNQPKTIIQTFMVRDDPSYQTTCTITRPAMTNRPSVLSLFNYDHSRQEPADNRTVRRVFSVPDFLDEDSDHETVQEGDPLNIALTVSTVVLHD